MEEQDTGVETAETGEDTEVSQTSEDSVEAADQQEDSKEKQGLIAARQAEASKRQEVEAERNYLREELSRRQQPAEELDPDEYVTRGQVEKRLGEGLKFIDNKQRHLENQTSLLAARSAHPKDFEKVYDFADKLCKEKPYMVGVLLSTQNVGEAIYEYGKTHKDYLKGATEEAVEKIRKNLSGSKTLSDATGASSAALDKAKFYMTRSKADHDADVRSRLGLD